MVGFQGTTLTDDLIDLLDDDLVTGVILFSRNIESLSQLRALNKKIRKHRHDVVIAVDQEGGPVQRLKEGVPHVPPMRDVTDENHAHRIGKELGVALRELGFTMNLAPVLDVDTNPDSPVIGERSFGPDPLRVARLGVAMAKGLGEAGILACGKHFPGHGDTALDSHVTMPVVQHGLDRLRRVEIPPFRAAINANIPALMSAHILVPALDPDLPATLSPSVVTDLLRHELGFEGVLLSDDLEMKAISERYPIDRAVTLCVEAGIDQLLVCHNLELQRKALATLRKSPPSRLGISLDRIDSMVRKAL
jgi:beta-N-acetylhexosaminidase